MNSPKVQLLNIEFDNLTSEELLAKFDEGLLVTPNVDHLIKLQKDEQFYQAYQSANFRVCDSRILYLLVKILFPKQALKAQITGSDFFPLFCHYHANKDDGARIFLLGGTDDSVLEAQNNINKKTQSNVIVGSYSPPFGFEKSADETQKIIDLINLSDADTLAIGVGAPKQEIWTHRHRHQLVSIKRFLAIGATIEFESGNLKRAPKWMTQFGVEWLFRLFQEPKRLFKRYILEDLPIFMHLLRQRFGIYRNPWGKKHSQ